MFKQLSSKHLSIYFFLEVTNCYLCAHILCAACMQTAEMHHRTATSEASPQELLEMSCC